MQLPTLYAPWRMDYIQSIDKPPPDGCFLCRAAEAVDAPAARRRDLLLLWSTEQTIVVINRYPYAHGHLLIAPKAHKPDLLDLTEAEGLDLHRQTKTALALLRRAVSAQGFNIGINVGRIAGAGLPGHMHQHVVPRWAGDANFISVVGEVRVVPQAIEQLYDALAKVHAEMS
jgi:ATP adenylyltransferase